MTTNRWYFLACILGSVVILTPVAGSVQYLMRSNNYRGRKFRAVTW